jgi:hypothetical protein
VARVCSRNSGRLSEEHFQLLRPKQIHRAARERHHKEVPALHITSQK